MTRFPIYPVTLTLAFVALDIAGEIDWSVWWLVSPLLIAFVIAVLVGLATADKKK